MTLKLYNTLTRRKDPFTPIDPSNVRMYVCGPTVYQRIHIGNARPLVVFDVLFRLLRHLYGEDKVTYVRNITDIDDRIINQVREDGVDGDLNAAVRALTDTTTEAFREDWRALGCLPPTHEPRATDHIPGMVEIISELIAKGHAYAAEGHVLFHVPSMPAYGRLSGRSTDDMIAGARVEVAPYKRHPADFVLWKPSTPDLPGWDSPWGRGRPGWHIECSAMSEALLGVPFDIHGGGQDLIFPHHENEIAQSCCAHGLDGMASVWMHNGFVDMRGEKMSKSVGNVVRAWEALEAADEVPLRRGEIIRMWMLGTHYRDPIDFDLGRLQEARGLLDGFYEALFSIREIEREFRPVGGSGVAITGYSNVQPTKVPADFLGPLLDDLNTPLALQHLASVAKKMNREALLAEKRTWGGGLVAAGKLLGLLKHSPSEWRKGQHYHDLVDHQAYWIAKMIDRRMEARRTRDFHQADLIRTELTEYGIVLEDRPDGTTDWRRA